MTNYVKTSKVNNLPRIPLEGSIDLTYRCNNNCRHCWVCIPPSSPKKEEELTFEEIKEIVNDARKMGCRKWSISGGEAMLRPDFAEIFDYITRKSVSYDLITNGTLITHEIAKLLKRKGFKVISLYGATAEVYDRITRNPGSFEATMRGISYLKEVGANLTVQVVPMRDNFHQFKDMIQFAKSISPSYSIGSSWLYLSANRDPNRNREIKRLRLDPSSVIELDPPDVFYEECMRKSVNHSYFHMKNDDRLFASCIDVRRNFHIDPFGQMSFCSMIKNYSLRYDLRRGRFDECWGKFIPSLADKIRGGDEYLENCGSCELRGDCLWCPVYAYLEHGRFSAKITYLCEIAKENRKYMQNWKKYHRRLYQIAGMTIQVDSDIPFKASTFNSKFEEFEVQSPSRDNIIISHRFHLPNLDRKNLGEEVYRNASLSIFKKGNNWIYLLTESPFEYKDSCLVAAFFNHDHARVQIYHKNDDVFSKGGLHSLSLLGTDQLFVTRLLADREGCSFHSSGVILEDKGLLFLGPSGAGKTTIANMLNNEAKILGDDRIIVRKWPEGFKVHGTWSHGELPVVSPESAPLQAIFFIEKDKENYLLLLKDKREIIKGLLMSLVQPFTTPAWWEKIFSLIEKIISEIPCYSLHFDKSDKAIDLLKNLDG